MNVVTTGAVLLTVPHSKCDLRERTNIREREYVHLCDNTAEKAAKIFYDILTNYAPELEVNIISAADKSTYLDVKQDIKQESKHPFPTRVLCDMNRWTTRNSCFRKKIRKWLSEKTIQYGPENVALLDIHSFPAGYKSYGKDDTDIVILDSHPEINTFEIPNLILSDVLNRYTSIYPRLLKGARDDISVQARWFDIAAVSLIEFNEQLPDEAIIYIAEVLAMWIRYWLSFVNKMVELDKSNWTRDCNEC